MAAAVTPCRLGEAVETGLNRLAVGAVRKAAVIGVEFEQSGHAPERRGPGQEVTQQGRGMRLVDLVEVGIGEQQDRCDGLLLQDQPPKAVEFVHAATEPGIAFEQRGDDL